MSRVVIYGATGFTGTLIAEQLQGHDIDLVLAGRDAARVRETASRLDADVQTATAQVHDAASLANAFRGATVVVTCAGPFSRVGEPVLRAAIEAGAHYIDTTGEQSFMRDMYERFESAARHARVAVINGLAFEIALGDWAAALAADALGRHAPLDELAVAYAVDDFRPSRGTQVSAIESLSGPGAMWAEDRWEPVAPAAESRTFGFPSGFGERRCVSFPSGEVISVPRHIETRRVQTYISLGGNAPLGRFIGRAVSLLGPAFPLLIQSPLGSLAKARAGTSRSTPTAEQRARSRFSIVAEASRGFERERIAVVGTDPYGLTAQIVARGVADLLNRDDRPLGVLAPAQVFDPRSTLDALTACSDLQVIA